MNEKSFNQNLSKNLSWNLRFSELYENNLHPIFRPNKGFVLPRYRSVTKIVTVRRLHCSSTRSEPIQYRNCYAFLAGTESATGSYSKESIGMNEYFSAMRMSISHKIVTKTEAR